METNQRSPEQSQTNTNRHTPAKEDAAKPMPKKTDAEIEETETGRAGEQPKKDDKKASSTVSTSGQSATGARTVSRDEYDAGSINNPDENSEEDTKDTI